jgi:phosphatidate cytidylyltransferase
MASEISARVVSGASMVAIVGLCLWRSTVLTHILLGLVAILALREWTKISRSRSVLHKCGVVYIVCPIIYWTILLYQYPDNNIYLILTILMTSMTDISAYICGITFRGPKIFPNISPSKTWSGTLLGVVSSTILSSALVWKMQHSLYLKNIIWIATIVVSAVVGDFLESKIKRILLIKDSGNIIPGHGGVLDRIDSFLFATYVYSIFRLFSSYQPFLL